MRMELINTERSPKAIGPYSQAVKVESTNMLFISGQLPLNVESMKIESSDVIEQTTQVMTNLENILLSQNASLSDVIKTTIYLTDLNDFDGVNNVYGSFFGDHKPARACIEVSKLPKDALVEIEAIAILNN